MSPTIDIENLGFDAGAHILVKLAVTRIGIGESLRLQGAGHSWEAPLAAWCRAQGHGIKFSQDDGRLTGHIVRGSAQVGRWRGAAATGLSDPAAENAVLPLADARWGLAARGATVEAGSPAFNFRLNRREEVWADSAADIYAEAVAAQWKVDEAIDWSQPFELPDELEDAVVQVMTYMIENENAALVVPARFLGQIHPHYREVQAVLAIQVADEARHVAFGMAHLGQRLAAEPALVSRLANAVEARHDHLSGTSGLNEEVFDALILLAAGGTRPADIAQGYGRVQELLQDMARGREARLAKLGFAGEAARRLAALHTRNFM